ncbi:MAG: hypothetical protein KIT69_16330, partial [Propionibacteriaceae bacterium]|nr:hypothetical protein [Propionibacteriaceae bacterium]
MTPEPKHLLPARPGRRNLARAARFGLLGLAAMALTACTAGGGEPTHTEHTSEFDLPLPDLKSAVFMNGA